MLCVSWRAGNYTFLWGMTLEEGVIYRLGTFRPMEPVRDMTSLKVQINDILPAQFDSRSEWPGLVHDVYDQGNCGSSWAFSTTCKYKQAYERNRETGLTGSADKHINTYYGHNTSADFI